MSINIYNTYIQCHKNFDSSCEFIKNKKSLNLVQIELMRHQILESQIDYNNKIIIYLLDNNLEQFIKFFDENNLSYHNIHRICADLNINYFQTIIYNSRTSIIVDISESEIDMLEQLINFINFYVVKSNKKYNSIIYKINNLYKIIE